MVMRHSRLSGIGGPVLRPEHRLQPIAAPVASGIEVYQGTDANENPFGYDHKRKNFIVWGIRKNKIIVLDVEHDEMATGHGSLAETLREAKREAKRVAWCSPLGTELGKVWTII
jgi:hypothetical protein